MVVVVAKSWLLAGDADYSCRIFVVVPMKLAEKVAHNAERDTDNRQVNVISSNHHHLTTTSYSEVYTSSVCVLIYS